MSSSVENQTKLIVFTAPSGAGKTTIVRHLLAEYNALTFSISATNRKPRPHEVDGKDYYFLSTEEFKKKAADGDFLEWEEVYQDQYYGTLKSEVNRLLDSGKHVVFDIDVRGAQSIKAVYGDRSLVVFIRPPSLNTLISRLKARNTESTASLNRRIERMKKEMTYENAFDTILVNDLLQVALREAEIIVSEFIGIESVMEEE